MHIIKNFHSCFWEQNLLTNAWFKEKAETIRMGSTCKNKKRVQVFHVRQSLAEITCDM